VPILSVQARDRHEAMSRSCDEVNFGCDYCADDPSRFFGHIIQVGNDDARRMILLRGACCGTLYENSLRGADRTRRLTDDEAKRLFPGHE
jgi:hypothetical protein